MKKSWNDLGIVKGDGAFIDVPKLMSLARLSIDKEIKTDLERDLVVALQNALVLAGLYRDGRAEES